MLSLSSLFAQSYSANAPLSAAITLEQHTFDDYLAHHGKQYSTVEEHGLRQDIFEQAKLKVIAHNDAYRAGSTTWWMALNEFADATPAEFAKLRSTKVAPSAFPVRALYESGTQNPDSIDWRTKGAVTKVKNQGGCGSCWAFSATETIESQYQIASGNLLTLSPQTFVDCVQNPLSCGGTGGCEGATMELAFNLTATAGIALESSLPYRGRDAACPAYTPAVKATGYVKNPTNDAKALETAIATKGPMSVTVAAASWQLYGGGMFKGCSRGGLFGGDNTLDHGVQAVGYTKDYWIVRNSWGAGWGISGYIHLSREADDQTFTDKHPADGVACKPVPKTQTVGGECGVLFDTSYPIGVTAA
jgi:cathepsin L